MIRSVLAGLCLLAYTFIYAQQPAPKAADKWTLQQCVEYAMKNNISVKQADLQSQFSALALKQSKASQLPSLNLGGNIGYSFGLSENLATGILENNTITNIVPQLQSQVTLFNWFAKKKTNAANKLTLEADIEQTKKAQNDIALNVAVAYLQILLAKEQINLSKIQLAQTISQLESTRKQVDAGKIPELNAAQQEAQLATDSSALITSEANAQQFILQLKALLNLDAAAVFEVEAPPVDMIPVEGLADLQPESVYSSALQNLPQQKVNEIRIKAAMESAAASKAFMYPSVSAFGGLSTRYVHLNGFPADKLGTQFRQNFGQNIGIGLNIPIFNGLSSKVNWQRSKLNIRNYELVKEQGDMQLKQDIYKAYVDATAAIQKFNANKKGVQTSQKAYEYASKRYDAGMLSTYELLISQNALQTARTQLLYAQFDYVFKMKLLEFYKGQGLKL